MKTCFIDTNIFLRVAIKENDKISRECSLFLNAAEEEKIKIVTSNFVLAEYVWTMNSYYKVQKDKILKSLDGIRVLKNIKFIDKVDVAKAISIFSQKNVKYIDAVIASNPNIISGKWIVISYDKDFDKIGVLRKEPGEIVDEFYN